MESQIHPPGARRFRGICTGLICSVLLLTAAAYAFLTIFGKFAFYDDEGFLMITVQGFLKGKPLYDNVFTIYGPFFYFWQWVVHGVSKLPLTHDVTGCLCALHWVVAAALLGWAAWRFSRAMWLACFVFMQATVHLYSLANEPGHPQEIVVILLALAAVACTQLTRSRASAIFLGGIGAALALTKINVGAFYCVALLMALIPSRGQGVRFSLLFVLAVLFSLAAPFLLIRGPFFNSWVYIFGIPTSLGLCACVLIVAEACPPGELPPGWRAWSPTGVGALGVCGALGGFLLCAGSSPSATLHCLIAVPAQSTAGFSSPFPAPYSILSAAASLAGAITYLAIRFRGLKVDKFAVVMKGLYGVIGTLVLTKNTTAQLSYLLPWVWLVAIPSGESKSSGERKFGRNFLCLCAAWQSLQVFPVAGTQTAVGTFVAVLVYSLCFYDLVEGLKPSLASVLARVRTAVVEAGIAVALVYVFLGPWCAVGKRWLAYSAQEPLALRGASLLRVRTYDRETYQGLCAYVRQQCDTFVAIPGFNSLYFWAEKLPPNYFNIGEVAILNREQQAEIVSALTTRNRALVIISDRHVESLTEEDVIGKGPLAQFIKEQCREVARFSVYRVLAPIRSIGMSAPAANDAAQRNQDRRVYGLDVCKVSGH